MCSFVLISYLWLTTVTSLALLRGLYDLFQPILTAYELLLFYR